MSPLAFKTSGKVTVPTPTPPQPKQPPKMDIAPLTQEQLVQALTYLLKVCFNHFSNTFYTHNALDIANPSSMQDITNATAGILGRKGVQFWTTRTLNYTCHCQLFLQ